MSTYRVFNEENEFGEEILSLYKYIRLPFWRIIIGDDDDCWQFIRSFSNYKEIDRYAKGRGWIEGDIFD
jgi:hypothetical protein